MIRPAILADRLKRLRKDRRGVSAVEFALILPIMMVLYAGTYEISESLAIERKQARVTSTLADLVSQLNTVSTAEMNNIFNAATAIMSPYPASGLEMQVIVVSITATNQTVAWSRARNATAATAGQTTPIRVPADIAVAGQQMVIARVSFTYASPFSSFMQSITGRSSYDLEETYMLRPRNGTSITFSG